jgi:hypothetical protein
MVNFYSFLRLSREFFAVLKTFWQISAKHMSFLHLSPEFFAVLKTFWQISAKHMSCWRPYCVFGVPSDVITVVG